MTDNSFKKVRQTGKRLYGPRKILICGYSQADRDQFCIMLNENDLSDIELIAADQTSLMRTLKDLFTETGTENQETTSVMHRAAIMAGITEKELHKIINAYRATRLPRQFWATLTPVSENWTLGDLLEELKKENEALQKQQLANK